jgi:hypothetical protein
MSALDLEFPKLDKEQLEALQAAKQSLAADERG